MIRGRKNNVCQLLIAVQFSSQQSEKRRKHNKIHNLNSKETTQSKACVSLKKEAHPETSILWFVAKLLQIVVESGTPKAFVRALTEGLMNGASAFH